MSFIHSNCLIERYFGVIAVYVTQKTQGIFLKILWNSGDSQGKLKLQVTRHRKFQVILILLN